MNIIGPDDAAWEERFSGLFRYAQVGRCVSGVTHDINNILGAIMAYAELVGLEKDLNDQARSMLDEVVNGVVRCTDLIGTLTSIAREEKPTANITDPARIVADVLKLREYALRTDRIRVECQVEENLSSIVADAPKLLLALIHLLMNAQEAVADAEVKIVRLRVSRQDPGVVFSVWDSAPPLSEAAAEAIFEAFRGTKNGYHMGFGLHAARQIAALHDGTLTYDAERGFLLFLPSRNKLIEQLNLQP